MIVLGRGRFGPPISRVLTQVRRGDPVVREDIARNTGLSASSVARAITTLVDVGLLRERPDLVSEGAVGRPSIPVELDPDRYVTIGCHIGRRTTTVSLNDLRGVLVARTGVATPVADVSTLAQVVAQAATGLLAKAPTRAVLVAGLVAPWGDIEYQMGETGSALSEVLGLAVETGDHIAAIAAAEYSARPQALPGSTVYIYSRDTVGFAMATERPYGTEISRVGRLGHFPTGADVPCRCGRTGCLEAVVSDESVAARAQTAGIIGVPEITLVHRAAGRGSEVARGLLVGRAEALGRIAAIVRDMVHPDRVILCGQGFTAYQPAMQIVIDSFNATTASGPADVSFTRFGAGVQAVAAGTVALRRVFDTPLEVVGADQQPKPAGATDRGALG